MRDAGTLVWFQGSKTASFGAGFDVLNEAICGGCVMASTDTKKQWLDQLRDDPSNYVTVDFTSPAYTVNVVPDLLRTLSPEYHKRPELQLGLHNRTHQTTKTQQLKVDIAGSLHTRLLKSNSSWPAFASAVVGDAADARAHYENSASDHGVPDDAVPYMLAMDALFLVVFFQFLNGRFFFFKEEFQHLGERLNDTALTLMPSDLLLVENQVPMYLLESVLREFVVLREGVPRPDHVKTELFDVLHFAVRHLYPVGKPDNFLRYLMDKYALKINCKHLLDCVYVVLCGHAEDDPPPSPTQSTLDSIPSVTRLQAMGISVTDTAAVRHLYPVGQPDNFADYLKINCKHLLDCVYVVLCGHAEDDPPPSPTPPKLDSIPSATRLQAMGISVTDTAATLDRIGLYGSGYVTNARLRLPKVDVYDYTEVVFHNLALHEQLVDGGRGGDLRCFLQCMGSLTDDTDDVRLLVDHGVVDNCVGSNLLGMWERVMRGVNSPSPSPLWQRLYQEIHMHRRSLVKQWRREIWVLFFSKPWTFVSLLGAIIVLFLTGVQTWFTVVNSSHVGWRWPR